MKKKSLSLCILAVLVIVLLSSSCQFITGEAPAQTTEPTPSPITSPPPPKTDWDEGSPPPEGIEGWEQPRSLTEDEKAKVIEIALSSPRALDWLQGRTDYRAGSVDWYAIIWNSNGEAGTWWSLEYDRVANEGIPDFVSPYAFWYPGVTIAVGEGTITQMQIAVDLNAGKTVMVMGPYPSLSSPDRFKNIPEPAHAPAVSSEQAIELATNMLPESVATVVARGDVRAELHGWYWEVTFDNINAEAEELMPFPLKGPPPGGSASGAYPGIYQSVVITVDAETGGPRSAGASKEPKPGPYVNRERAIESAREGVLGFLMDPSWLERAKVEAYLRGDIWIVLFWEEGASIEDRSSGLSVNRFQVSVDAVTGKVVRSRRG